jgi:hypothetical protein
MKQKIISSLFAIAWCLALYFFASFVWDAIDARLSNEVTIYQEMCINHEVSVFDCPSSQTVYSRNRFRVDYARQSVIEAVITGAETKKNCAVYDQTNWRCEEENGLSEQMRDGDYFIYYPNEHVVANPIQIFYINYLFHQL